MSRHRNVRSLNYEDEYYDDDDAYGHSVEDNYCISPGTAAQFTFNRDRQLDLANYMGEAERIPEEDEEEEETQDHHHRNSLDYTRPQLNDLDNAKLNSCLEEVRNVLGETVPEHIMVETIVKNNFNLDSSLNELLNQHEAPKPQREKKENRRNRSQEFDYESVPANLAVIDPSQLGQESHTRCTEPENIMSFVLPQLGGSMKFGPGSSPDISGIVMSSDHLTDHKIIKPLINHPNQKSENDLSKPKPESGCETQKEIHPNLEENQKYDNSVKYSDEIYSDVSNSLSGLIQTHNIPRPFKNVGSGSQDNSSFNALDTNITKGKDASQADTCGTSGKNYTQPSSKSKLPVLDQKNKADHVKKGFPPMSLEKSKQQAPIAKTEQKPGQSLADLAESQTKPLQMNTLTDLTTKNTQRNQNDALLSSLSQLARSTKTVNSNNTGVKSDIKDDVKLNNKRPHVLTSTDLSSCPGKVNDKKSMTLSVSPKPGGLSLADLAKSHGVQNKQAATSLLDLAKAHEVGKTGAAIDGGKLNPANQHVTSILTQGPKVKDTQTVMDSLSSHLDNYTLEVRQQFGYGQVKRNTSGSNKSSTTVTVNEQAMMGTETKYATKGGNVSSMTLTDLAKPPQQAQVPGNISNITLADLAKNPQQVPGKVSNMSLADLAKPPQPLPGNVSNMSLADLAKPPQPLPGNVSNITLADLKKKGKPPDVNSSQTTNKVTDISSALAPYCIEIRQEDSNILSGIHSEVAMAVMDDFFLLTSGDSLSHTIDQYIARPSVLGKVVCLRMRIREREAQRGYRNKHFQYRHQAQKIKRTSQCAENTVVPFDFNSPSPDDIVKSRQKMAFTRSGDRR